MRAVATVAALFGLLFAGIPVAADPPASTRDELICRVKSSVGFSYWWGHSCWCANGCSPNLSCGAGGCSGSCPDCTHWGGYGADCSGLTNKVWMVPSAASINGTCSHGPLTASSYHNTEQYWTHISRSSAQKADAYASTGHVLIYESGDPWGSMWAYEAKGCSYGIVHNIRTCSSSYNVSRRMNIVVGECNPGETQSQGCGNCGTKTRTCQSNGSWGGWGACSGQGACAPDDAQSQACGDCGHQERSCSASCQWSAWGGCLDQGTCAAGTEEQEACGDCGARTRSCDSGCAWTDWSPCGGPDPGDGKLACDTGEPGVCADGLVRCLEGWTTCVRQTDPGDEVCDGLDNDCDGDEDEGAPQVMGAVPPPFAAALEDLSYPKRLAPGQVGVVWAAFRNLGAVPWTGDQVRLGLSVPSEASPHQPPGAWPAWDVPAVVDGPVAPGQVTLVRFEILGPDAAISSETRFSLRDPWGGALRCPAPGFTLETGPDLPLGVSWLEASLDVQAGETAGDAGEDGVGDDADRPGVTGGCTAGRGSTVPVVLTILMLFGLLALRRRGFDSWRTR